MAEAFEITYEKRPKKSLLPAATWSNANGELQIPCAKCPTLAKIHWNGTPSMILVTKCENCADAGIWQWKDCIRCKLGVAFRSGIEQSLYCPKCRACVHKVQRSVLQYLWILPALGLFGRAVSGWFSPSEPHIAKGKCGIPSYGINGEYLDFTDGQIKPTAKPIWFESMPSEFHQFVKSHLNPEQQSKIKGVVNIHPESFQSWADPAWVCKMGEYQDRMFAFALSQQLGRLGKAAMASGKFSDAEASYMLSLALLPGPPTTQDPNYDAHGQLAELYSKTGKQKLAKTHALAALTQYQLSEQQSQAASEKLDDEMRQSVC